MHRAVLNSIERVLRGLAGRFNIIRLSDYASGGDVGASNVLGLRPTVARLAKLNTTWFMRGETRTKGWEEYQRLAADQLFETAKRVAVCLDADAYDYLLLPGGIYGSSGVWYALAKERGVRPVTFDTGFDCVLFSADGVAAQLHDLPRAFEQLRCQEDTREWVLSQAQIEREKRQQRKDKFMYQVPDSSPLNVGEARGVLVALNSPWDSACLGLHRAFADSSEWILETVRWILDNTQEMAIVRQHPGERLSFAKSNDDIGKLLLDAYGPHPRILYLAAESPVNTYELLDRVHTVLVRTSTVGVEAALMGKVVITGSNPYYSDMGFVYTGATKGEYFELLGKASAGELSVSEAQVEAACYCYYLGQCCNWMFCDFTPYGLPTWAAMNPVSLYERGEVQLILTAIDENIPISILQHEKALRSAARTAQPANAATVTSSTRIDAGR